MRTKMVEIERPAATMMAVAGAIADSVEESTDASLLGSPVDALDAVGRALHTAGKEAGREGTGDRRLAASKTKNGRQ